MRNRKFWLLFSVLLIVLLLPAGFAWKSPSWQYRKTITFNNAAADSDLNSFPVLVDLNSGNFTFSKALNNGADIRFVDSDDTTDLNYEIENWDNGSQSAQIWVRVPKIDVGSTTDSIYMYYGNSAAGDGNNNAGVWDDSYVAVWHLNEASGTIFDSSGSEHHCTATNAEYTASGMIAGAWNIDSGDYITCTESGATNLDISSQVTLEAWVELDALSSWNEIVGKMNTGSGRVYGMWIQNDADMLLSYYSGGWYHWYPNGQGCFSTGTWTYLAGVIDTDNDDRVIYFDAVDCGSDLSTSIPAFQVNDQPIYFGSASGTWPSNGRFDEIRISDANRSLEWIEATYISAKNAFNTFGAEEVGSKAISIPKTFLGGKPRGFFGIGQTVTIQVDVNETDMNIGITDANSSTQVANQAMTLFESNSDGNTFTYDFNVTGVIGWVDLNFPKANKVFGKIFYIGETWNTRWTDPSSNTYPFSFDINVSETADINRWFEPVSFYADFNFNTSDASVRILDHNGNGFVEIPSQVNYLVVSSGKITNATVTFQAGFAAGEDRNFFVSYSSSDHNKNYPRELTSTGAGTYFDFKSQRYTVRLDLNQGGLIQYILQKQANITDSNVSGYNPMQYSPEAKSGPTTYASYSLTNPTTSLDINGPVKQVFNTKGTVSGMDYNIRYSFYSRLPYIFVDMNVSPRLSESWNHFYDSYIYASGTPFTKFAYLNTNLTTTAVTQSGNGSDSTNIGDMNFIALYDEATLAGLGIAFVSQSSTRSNSPDISFYDDSSYEYWFRNFYNGSVTSTDLFETKQAIVLFNSFNGIEDLNNVLISLKNSVTVSPGITYAFDSNSPVQSGDFNYTPFTDVNDTDDVNVNAIWTDNLELDYADINCTGPDLNVITQLSLDTNRDTVFYLIDSNILNAGKIDCNFSVYDIGTNFDTNTISFYVKDVSAPSISREIHAPDLNKDIDPGTQITVDVNLREYTAIKAITLYTRRYYDSNATWSDWNTITMVNDANFSDYNYQYTAPFRTPDVNAKMQYYINAKDTNNYDANSDTNTIYSYWDYTWFLEPGAFGTSTSTALDTNVTIGDINIVNTGDKTLNFKINSNWDNPNNVFYDGNVETTSGYSFALEAGGDLNFTTIITSKTTERQDSLTITANPSELDANPDSNTSTVTIISSAGGPFLYLEWTDTNTNVMLEDTGVTYTIKVTNKGNMDANNVTLAWALPSNWTITTGVASTILATDLIVNEAVTDSITVTIGESAQTGRQTLSFTTGCCTDGNKTRSESITVTITQKPAEASPPADDDDDDPTTGGTTLTSAAAGTTILGGRSVFSPTQQKALFQTAETFEITIGTDQRFAITIKNPVEGTLKDVKITVEGLLSKYLTLTTEQIGELAEGESIKIYTEITSPEYFTPGKHTLKYIIIGTLVAASGKETPFTETRSVVLMIHETSRLQALGYIKQVKQMLESMKQKGYKTENLEKWNRDIQILLQEREYDEIKKVHEQAQQEQQNANNANQLIKELEAQLKQAKTKQIPTPNTTRLLKIATRAFDRGNYATALEKLKEAQLTYAVETKGEFNIQNFLTTKWQQITALSTILFVAFYFFTLWIKWGLLKRKLEKLQTEEALLLELIKDTQRRCFIENKISMGEYYDSLKQFEETLSKNIETTIELQSKKSNLFRFKPTLVRLNQEKSELLGLIKQTQKEYFKEGLIETRVYQTKMRSFSERLSKIEKNIVLKQATKALKQNTGWQKPIWQTIYKIWK